jgi:hypothetical protein
MISVEDFKEKFADFIDSLDEADKTPYGDVSYADPGYQADKKSAIRLTPRLTFVPLGRTSIRPRTPARTAPHN